MVLCEGGREGGESVVVVVCGSVKVCSLVCRAVVLDAVVASSG